MRLLADVREVFGAADRLPTATLLDRLAKLDEAPWETFMGGRPLDPRRLADMLREYGITSSNLRLADGQVLGLHAQ